MLNRYCPACGKPVSPFLHYTAPATQANIFPCPHCGKHIVFGGWMGIRILQIVSFIGFVIYALSSGDGELGWTLLGLIGGLEVFFLVTTRPYLLPTTPNKK
jgi:hypothetical protein